MFHDATWYLRSSLTSGVATSTFRYGRSGDLPVMGDWDGDGDDTIGVVRGDTWLRRNRIAGGAADISLVYGSSLYSELPVLRDWDGNGTYTPAVLRNRPPTDEAGGFEDWLFRSNTGGAANGEIIYGSDAQTIDPPIEFIPRLSWK